MVNHKHLIVALMVQGGLQGGLEGEEHSAESDMMRFRLHMLQ